MTECAICAAPICGGGAACSNASQAEESARIHLALGALRHRLAEDLEAGRAGPDLVDLIEALDAVIGGDDGR